MDSHKTDLQKKHYEKLKENRNKISNRKKRTHRLIVRGALAEKAIPNATEMSDKEFENYLSRAIEITRYYDNYIQSNHQTNKS